MIGSAAIRAAAVASILAVAAACSDMTTGPELSADGARRDVPKEDGGVKKGGKGGGGTTATTNPLSGASFFVDPYSNARRQADEWRATRPADAAQMDKIANNSQADWFGEWSGDIASAVDRRVSAITAAGAMPVLVAYNIPQRDCGGLSGGGGATADAYRGWISGFADGLRGRRAAVILEPDALPMLDCLSAADRELRLQLLRDAVDILKRAGALVYLDAGHSRWHAAATIGERLRAAGIAAADGFALNVSNFIDTASNVAYGEAVSRETGGKHFVVDTSRNGAGATADNQWCNPTGRALGTPATTRTGNALVDAFLWIKRPGESDGACNGGPSAGRWWADYALGLAQRASW